MGREATCRVTHRGESSEARVLLETSEIVVRGDLKLRIPFDEMKRVRVRDGVLRVTASGSETVFDLGPEAELWAARIKSPPSVLDKLDVKAGSRVRLVDLDDAALDAQVRERATVVGNVRGTACDLVLLRADAPAGLKPLARLREAIAPAGAVWVLWPKGRKELTEGQVRAAAEQAGLVDVKVASVSARLSALKLVIPRAAR